MNCICEGIRLLAPYKTLMPHDLILPYGELYNYLIVYHNVIVEIVYDKCNVLDSSPNHPVYPVVHGKIVFYETGPWCQKGWGTVS